MDSRLLVGQLFWCGDGSSLVGAVLIVLDSVVHWHAMLNDFRHDVRKYVARIRPVAVYIFGRA
jgi:hypothetical protein